MGDDDLIRRGDAVAKANDGVLKYLTEEFETPPEAYIREAIAALPAADPLADPRVRALVEAGAAILRNIGGLDGCDCSHCTSGHNFRAALTAIQEAKP